MQADKIEQLPGQPDMVDFDQCVGYVTIDPKAERALFYYVVESAVNSSFIPLVLLLNGGPECTSLGYGAMEELGPSRVNSDGKTLFPNYETYSGIVQFCGLLNGNVSDRCWSYADKTPEEMRNIEINKFYTLVSYFNPCSDTYMEYYLNNANVQSALHTKRSNWTGRPAAALCFHPRKLGAHGDVSWVFGFKLPATEVFFRTVTTLFTAEATMAITNVVQDK
ncbi:unnamed protein product [Fraxinus pennsylvanica]|uniref:Serine carboxypeptidase n=1 Tax=Fraxinus pennsylvanica TaxID=56036 RepID=A0AAD1ZYP0_9LAMI|nr:unnamed protein product [Fraxinus pennsylvanica]